MSKDISNYIDIHKGQKALVLAHGYSANKILHSVNKLKEQGYIIIGMNEWYYVNEDVVPDYWIIANGYYMRHEYETIYRYLKKYPSIAFIYVGDDNKIVPGFDKRLEELPNEIATYCRRTDNRQGNEQTIQEMLSEYTGVGNIYTPGSTILVHALALAILTGCSDIYYIGAELDYRAGYAGNKSKYSSANDKTKELDPFRTIILQDIQMITDMAKSNIVNLTYKLEREIKCLLQL
jgi:hypothetical protein